MTLNLDADTQARLDALSAALGYSKEMAAVYAIRLVYACAREGLIRDMDACTQEQWLPTGTLGKVIAFDTPDGRSK